MSLYSSTMAQAESVSRSSAENISDTSLQLPAVPAVQRVEEDETAQVKADPIQKAGALEEEPAQGKFEAVQMAGALEEEPAQGKFDPLQKKIN